MATFQAGGFGSDLGVDPGTFDDMAGGTPESTSGTHSVIDGAGGYAVYTLAGKFGSFDNAGVPQTGTLDTFQVTSSFNTDHQQLGFILSDFHMKASSFAAFVAGDNVRAFLKAVLAGDDTVKGGHGPDSLFGYTGNDIITGGAGDDLLCGGAGHDTLTGGSGDDTYVYVTASQSTGADFDTVAGFDFAAADRFRFDFTVKAIDQKVTGSLSDATFDADLTAAADDLGKHHARLFAVTHGDYKGDIFLIVDADGKVGYQTGSDFVIALTNVHHLAMLDVADFTTP